jgi:two-component system sensor histidine kinase MprB
MPRLTLRARLALLTATAVALAVAVASVVCWFLTSNQLHAQLDRTLDVSASSFNRPDAKRPRDPAEVCRRPAPAAFQRTLLTYQVVQSDGSACTQPGSSAVHVTKEDVRVAAGAVKRVFHNSTTVDGTDVRVMTVRYGQGTAVSVARPLNEITSSLRSLALWLVFTTALGVLAAATCGLLIARAGLRPVHRLTRAAEHIARTEDLDTTIDAAGEDEIARLSRAFNAMTTSLKASRTRQRQLVADAGHELRTPLTSLRANIDLLLRSHSQGRPLPDADKERLLHNLKAQSLELSDLVGDLLQLAQDRPAQPPGTVPLHDVVKLAVDRARLRAGAGVRIATEVEPWFVRGDAAALERAVVNLLDNAVKFAPDSAGLEVALRNGELTVRDHGPGVCPADLPFVFERFWRSDAARGMPGSGLGLAIVARAVADSGGTAVLEAAAGGGTVARVNLPGSARADAFGDRT